MVEKDVDISSADESEEEQEEIVLGGKREPYNDQEGLVAKLNLIKSSLNWLEHLDITVNLKNISLPGTNEEQEKKGLKSELQDDFKGNVVLLPSASISKGSIIKA